MYTDAYVPGSSSSVTRSRVESVARSDEQTLTPAATAVRMPTDISKPVIGKVIEKITASTSVKQRCTAEQVKWRNYCDKVIITRYLRRATAHLDQIRFAFQNKGLPTAFLITVIGALK
jgi:hypothetical protein